MALLRSALGLTAVAALATVGACYEPSVRDCAVSCTGGDQCAADQVCRADGWCTAPGYTGSCATDAARPDAAPDDATHLDGPTGDATDAGDPIDAGDATLRLVISGRGRIVSDQPGVECAGNAADCSFTVRVGTRVVLTAQNIHPNFQFVDWSTPNCMGQGMSCTLTVAAPLTLVGATYQ